MNLGRTQIFFALAATLASTISILAEPNVDQTYRINLADVDGNNFSTAGGRITIVVATSQANIDKARAVGDRVPDFCLANPTYRMITVVAFESKHSAPIRAILRSVIRHRLDSEAERLQKRYDERKIARSPRLDVFAVADFDGSITAQFGLKPETKLFKALVFGKDGELLKQWDDVPTAEELSSALKRD